MQVAKLIWALLAAGVGLLHKHHVSGHLVDLVLSNELESAVNLTEHTFDAFVANTSAALIFFYAPWCLWSRSMFPVFNESTRLLESQNASIRTATVDASRYISLRQKYAVEMYPSFLLLVNGMANTFMGLPASGSYLTEWVMNRINSLLRINTLEQWNLFDEGYKQEPKMICFFLDNDTSTRNQLLLISPALEKVRLFESSNRTVISRILDKYKASKELAKKALEEDRIIFFVKPNAFYTAHIESPIVPYEELTQDINATALIHLGHENSLPIVVHLDNKHDAISIQQKPFVAFLFFHSNATKGYLTPAYATFYHLAKKFSSDIFFTFCDGTEKLHQRLADLLGVESATDTPTLRLAKMIQTEFGQSHIQYQYRPSPEDIQHWNAESLASYFQKVKDGRAKFFLKSEPIPDPALNTGPVFTLVADEFEETVYKSKNVILLDVFAPWCGHCRRLEKTIRDLALILKPVSGVYVMKIDATQNELPFFIVGYPTILLFTPDSTTDDSGNFVTKKVTHFYRGERSVMALLNWISQHSPIAIDVPALLKQFEKENPQHDALRQPVSDRYFDEL